MITVLESWLLMRHSVVDWALLADTKLFLTKQFWELLRGTVHWGVPGELNTFKGFFSVGIHTTNRNPYISYRNWSQLTYWHQFRITYNNKWRLTLLHYCSTLHTETIKSQRTYNNKTTMFSSWVLVRVLYGLVNTAVVFVARAGSWVWPINVHLCHYSF